MTARSVWMLPGAGEESASHPASTSQGKPSLTSPSHPQPRISLITLGMHRWEKSQQGRAVHIKPCGAFPGDFPGGRRKDGQPLLHTNTHNTCVCTHSWSLVSPTSTPPSDNLSPAQTHKVMPPGPGELHDQSDLIQVTARQQNHFCGQFEK